jgi:hypothetical protein
MLGTRLYSPDKNIRCQGLWMGNGEFLLINRYGVSMKQDGGAQELSGPKGVLSFPPVCISSASSLGQSFPGHLQPCCMDCGSACFVLFLPQASFLRSVVSIGENKST